MMQSQAELSRNAKQVRGLVRAFSMLEVIACSPRGISLRDLSRLVGLHKSTALRMLRTMATLGYVAQTGEAKLYRIGDRLSGIAAGHPGEQRARSEKTRRLT
ncbi:helix-turn-helix domain-containing protein [Reyranella sp.]|uniref:helix-turn-helix domain-containing protein n=1 Tax=Reyranella sp. TaxID=1929291 RepID=UPI003782D732